MLTATYVLAAFVIGYLLGDRRGVKQANEILDHNMRVILSAVQGEPAEHVDNEDENRHPTLH